MTHEPIDTHHKAVTINLNPSIYGTFAEIGAGQEIARWFFRVGGAAGTVAKTMSAYDMTFSDAIYGKTSRYVSREKVVSMLDHEYSLLLERLGSARGPTTTFFAFADTVSARNYQGTNQCHGWIGIRFQGSPGEEPNDILMHVNMIDSTNLQQQEALGILGVNLLYAAYHCRASIQEFLQSLLDGLSIDRIEIDLLQFAGPDFVSFDNRVVGIVLLQLGLANAIIYDPDGNLLQPSEVIYKRAVMIERGAFRALKNLSADYVEAARHQFANSQEAVEYPALSLLELSVNELSGKEPRTPEFILSQIDDLWELGYTVMLTRFGEFFQLSMYLRRYTKRPIGFLMGVSTVCQLFNEQYYTELKGRMLEGIARLFAHDVSLHVYPMIQADYEAHLQVSTPGAIPLVEGDRDVVCVDELAFPAPLNHLFAYLREAGWIRSVIPT